MIGAARPVLIEAVQAPVDGSGLDSRPSIEGERLQRHLDCVEPYTITADASAVRSSIHSKNSLVG